MTTARSWITLLNLSEIHNHKAHDHFYALELKDIYERSLVELKKLPVKDGMHAWCAMMEDEDVLVCWGISLMLEHQGNTSPTTVLRGTYSLACNISDLKLFLERRGVSHLDWEAHRAAEGYTRLIERRGYWRWVLRGDPFASNCYHQYPWNCAMSCWQKRLQRVETGEESGQSAVDGSSVSLDNSEAGIVFGILGCASHVNMNKNKYE
jgi:hypothetical protein